MSNEAKKKIPSKVRHKRNIEKSLFEFWRKCLRQGDPMEITKLLHPVSKPTIDRALLFGNVKKERADFITNFFKQRLLSERAEAQQLKALLEPEKINEHDVF